MIREMLKALLLGNEHPYFNYYMAKLNETNPESEGSEEPDSGIEH